MDVADLKGSASQLAEIGSLFDSVPVEASELKQCAPAIALYKTKLGLVRLGVRNAFLAVLKFEDSAIFVNRESLYDTPSLWMAANTLKIESVIVSDIVKSVSGLFDKMMKQPIAFSTDEYVWRYKPVDEQSRVATVCEGFLSLINFLKVTFFVSLGGDRVFSEFGKRIWPGPKLVKEFGLCRELVDLEAAAVQVGFSGIPVKIANEYSRSLVNEKQQKNGKILSEIRVKLLADVNRKIRKLDKSPETAEIKGFKFIPNMVSVEVGRIPSAYLKNADSELIKSIISMFCLLRQTQYVDPKGINARMMGIFFNDTIFLSVALTMLGKYPEEISMLKVASQRSTTSFVNSVVARSIERLLHYRDKSWDLGLTNKAQLALADRDVNDTLMQIAACVSDWKTVEIDPEIMCLWASMMLEKIVREMNKLAVETAKRAAGAPSAVSELYAKFLNSIEKMLPPNVLGAMASVRLGQKIRTALAKSLTDINDIKDPLVTDEFLYGTITRDGFEALLKVNPLLNEESKESIRELSGKFMVANSQDAPKTAA